jgi:hypothetical protein
MDVKQEERNCIRPVSRLMRARREDATTLDSPRLTRVLKGGSSQGVGPAPWKLLH